jgi:putative spermidine/putrescine transport system ATP-binding protein
MLELKSLNKVYPGGTVAVKNLSLSLVDGEMFVLLGPSGCGKTTTLRMVAGLERPSGGQVFLDNTDITALTPEKRNIGLVFQDYALFPHLTVAQNVAFGLRVRRLHQEKIREKVAKVLELVRIPELTNRLPKTLSGGQKQRVALARALVVEPRMLLLDEPLAALDAKLREELRQELSMLLKNLSITTLYITHDQTEALSLGHRIGVMRAGELVQVDTPREIYQKPANSFVARFIGSANIFAGKVAPGQKIDLGFSVLEKRHLINKSDFVNMHPGKPVKIIVRPEHLVPAEGSQAFSLNIKDIYFLGDRLRIMGSTVTGTALSADLAGTFDTAHETPLQLAFMEASVYLEPEPAVKSTVCPEEATSA